MDHRREEETSIHLVDFRLEPSDMCRNIRPLFNFDPPASESEIRDASLQFLRKISGFSRPSRVNEHSFTEALDRIARVSITLLRSLETNAEPRNRGQEIAKAKARYLLRYPQNPPVKK